jgi:hypothetical protein
LRCGSWRRLTHRLSGRLLTRRFWLWFADLIETRFLMDVALRTNTNLADAVIFVVNQVLLIMVITLF